eukprot:gene1934-2369_t
MNQNKELGVNIELTEQNIFKEWTKYLSRVFNNNIGIRTFYINYCMNNFINTNSLDGGQIVLCGAGLDSRALRFKNLTSKFTVFEVDLPQVIEYKEKILLPLELSIPRLSTCKIVRKGLDLFDRNWIEQLKANGFDPNVPTFWLLEGLVMYFTIEQVESLLKTISNNSPKGSQFFIDTVGVLSKEFELRLNRTDAQHIFDFFKNNFKYLTDDPDPFFGSFGFQVKTRSISQLISDFDIPIHDPSFVEYFFKFSIATK